MNSAHHTRLTRRGFCLCCLGAATLAATGGWLSPPEVFAQARTIVDAIRDEAAKSPIKVHKLRRNIAVLEGSGGNIAVLTGGDGALLVDAGITASRPRILEALDGLAAGPVKHLINTHWHFDHADGNEWLHSVGAGIVAHENTRKHLMAAQRVNDWNFDFPPSPAGAIPSDVFAGDQTMTINNTSLALKHRPNAHTDGDITVGFTEADVFHTGDIYWNGIYPFIDYSTGGGINGVIQSVDTILGQVGDTTIIIPGHGKPVSSRTELLAYRDMLVAIRDNVAKLKGQGRTIDDVIAAKPTAAYDAKWGQFVIDPAFFTRLVFEGV